MRFALVSVGATLLVAVIALINWYGLRLVKPTANPQSLQTSATLASAAAPSVTNSSAEVAQLKELIARCKLAMTKDVCGIMNSSSAGGNGGSSARLFIAGVGEVDSNAFTRLRAAGDQMCREVETECEANWSSSSCKLARVLYPR